MSETNNNKPSVFLNLKAVLLKYLIILRYIVSGSTAFAVNFVFLYIFTEVFGIWYLSSAILSFTFSLIVSFLLQKIWTFQNKDMEKADRQLSFYLVITIVNLAVNTILMYWFVGKMEIHYLLAQIITSIIISLYSFLIYKHFVFKVRPNIEEVQN